jgi:hypothetical protein
MPGFSKAPRIQDQKHIALQAVVQADSSTSEKKDDVLSKRKIMWIAAGIFTALALGGSAVLIAPLAGVTLLAGFTYIITTSCGIGVAELGLAACLWSLSKTDPFVPVTINDPCKFFEIVNEEPVKDLAAEVQTDCLRADAEQLYIIPQNEDEALLMWNWLEHVNKESDRGDHLLKRMLTRELRNRPENPEQLIPRISQALVQRCPKAFQKAFIVPRLETLFGLPKERIFAFDPQDVPRRELLIPAHPDEPVQVKVTYPITKIVYVTDEGKPEEIQVNYIAEAIITFDPQGRPECDTMTMVFRNVV